jgi:hypothetical protein
MAEANSLGLVVNRKIIPRGTTEAYFKSLVDCLECCSKSKQLGDLGNNVIDLSCDNVIIDVRTKSHHALLQYVYIFIRWLRNSHLFEIEFQTSGGLLC